MPTPNPANNPSDTTPNAPHLLPPNQPTPHPPTHPPGELLQKLLSTLKPTGHLSHILNAGTDNAILGAAKEAHAAGKGPGVSNTLVQPNGAQLQEVRVGWVGASSRFAFGLWTTRVWEGRGWLREGAAICC